MAKRVKGEWADSIPYTHKAFRPHITVLGQLTLAWNDLHQTLAILFCSVMGGGFPSGPRAEMMIGSSNFRDQPLAVICPRLFPHTFDTVISRHNHEPYTPIAPLRCNRGF
jgi:hypothetical protein